MELQTAIDNFRRAVNHCDNIIAVHRGHGGGGRGRRFQETSLDRAVVVLAVAAWQAAVQDMTRALLDSSAPPTAPALDFARYSVITGPVRTAIHAFATPNAQNTRRLMDSAGFDPWPFWTWDVPRVGGRPLETWRSHHVSDRLDEWLQIRHAIAHGHDELPVVRALESVRTGGKRSDPTIRLRDAEACVKFIRRLVTLTALAAAAHLGIAVDAD